jgi:hypothetical protein
LTWIAFDYQYFLEKKSDFSHSVWTSWLIFFGAANLALQGEVRAPVASATLLFLVRCSLLLDVLANSSN